MTRNVDVWQSAITLSHLNVDEVYEWYLASLEDRGASIDDGDSSGRPAPPSARGAVWESYPMTPRSQTSQAYFFNRSARHHAPPSAAATGAAAAVAPAPAPAPLSPALKKRLVSADSIVAASDAAAAAPVWGCFVWN